jgi:hypothetical protein
VDLANLGGTNASFYEKGIPTLGLYTGADRSKSEADAGLFGGAAGRPYDPCYHRRCDWSRRAGIQWIELGLIAQVCGRCTMERLYPPNLRW